jgi:hypothetical protein
VTFDEDAAKPRYAAINKYFPNIWIYIFSSLSQIVTKRKDKDFIGNAYTIIIRQEKASLL